MIISLIAAVSQNNIIGKNNDLPWRLPDDMKFFMETTKGHHCIMGRKNYESILPKFRPLPNRTNIIVTRQKSFKAPGCIVINTIEKGLDIARNNGEAEVFIIGGAEIYKLGMEVTQRMYLTEIHAHIDGDIFFPDFEKKDWHEVRRQNHPIDDKHPFSYDYVVYERRGAKRN